MYIWSKTGPLAKLMWKLHFHSSSPFVGRYKLVLVLTLNQFSLPNSVILHRMSRKIQWWESKLGKGICRKFYVIFSDKCSKMRELFFTFIFPLRSVQEKLSTFPSSQSLLFQYNNTSHAIFLTEQTKLWEMLALYVLK